MMRRLTVKATQPGMNPSHLVFQGAIRSPSFGIIVGAGPKLSLLGLPALSLPPKPHTFCSGEARLARRPSSFVWPEPISSCIMTGILGVSRWNHRI